MTAPQNASQICDIDLGFTSPEKAEKFDNMTTFTITPDFSNHHWGVEAAEIYAEDAEQVRFVLELVQLYPDQAGFGVKNCSSEISYDLHSSGSGSVAAGAGNWGVVFFTCFSLSRVLVTALKG